MPLPRIAVVGGDGRAERVVWPDGYDVRVFPTMEGGGERRAKDAVATGRYALVILMTKWIGHTVKLNAKTQYWDRGFPELARALPDLLPPGAAQDASADDHWYEREVAMGQPEMPRVEVPKARIKIDDAIRLIQRDLELLADGLLDEAEVLISVERVLNRGVLR